MSLMYLGGTVEFLVGFSILIEGSKNLSLSLACFRHSHCMAQAGLELAVILSQLLLC